MRQFVWCLWLKVKQLRDEIHAVINTVHLTGRVLCSFPDV